ncbi:hypothetical protein S1OALGB6SA_2158, partial [Olavius algarvensis spirochete endosymbiont]
RYEKDFYGGKSNPGGGSSDNDDDDDGSGGGGYFGRKPSVPVEDDGYTPRDTDNPPPSDDENNGDGGSSDNDDDDDDDRNGNTQNRQDQSPNDDNEDSDGSPSNDNRNADKRVSFLLQDDFKNFGKDIDNLFAAQSCAVASTCNALIKEFKSQTGKYPYENDIMKGVKEAIKEGHILNTEKDAGYVKDWAGAANTIWNEINPDDGGTWESSREGSPSDEHSIVAFDYLDYNEDEGPDHFSNQETMEVSTSVFRGSSLAAKLPKPLYDHPEAPSVVRRGHVPKKVIKGFSDVTDGEFKAFGRDIDRSFNPDTLYIIRPDGNIRPVDKETAIVGYRYLNYKEADEEKE